jgi:hypothetical protein
VGENQGKQDRLIAVALGQGKTSASLRASVGASVLSNLLQPTAVKRVPFVGIVLAEAVDGELLLEAVANPNLLTLVTNLLYSFR